MSGYTENEREWAVVDRLAHLLSDPSRSAYNVTQTYALFSAILSWVLQRIRTNGSGEGDKLAKAVWRRLEEEKASQPPWQITHRSGTKVAVVPGSGTVMPFVGWEDLSAAELVRGLRNASAHGDGRSVLPILQWRGKEEVLSGFELDCELRIGKNDRKGEKWEVLWSGKIALNEAEMIAIGNGLAQLFCEVMKKMDRKLDTKKSTMMREAA